MKKQVPAVNSEDGLRSMELVRDVDVGIVHFGPAWGSHKPPSNRWSDEAIHSSPL